jgi:hypothetical protein
MATKQTEEKLSISDITFDDFIGDGLETKEKESETTSEELDNDIKKKSSKDEDEDDAITDSEEQEEDDEEGDENSSKSSRKNTKDEEDEDGDDGVDNTSEDSDSSIAQSIAKALGYEIDNNYADTEEGLVEFTKDIAQNIAEDQIQELFSQFPLVQKHLDYVLAGGDSEKFFTAYNPNSDYTQMELDKSDSRMQKMLITDYFKSKGHDDEFIKDTIEDYEDTGKLYDKAAVAQKQLASIQAKEREQLVQMQKQQQLEMQQKQQEFWEGVANTIDEGKEFAGIKIPEKEKSKFFDYISSPVNKQGNTKRDMDYSSAPLETKLAIDYLLYKGFNLSDIITTKAKTESAKNLREKLQLGNERVRNQGMVDKKVKRFDPDQLDMKRLFE